MGRGYLAVLAVALFVGVALGGTLPKYPQKAAEEDMTENAPHLWEPHPSTGMTRHEFMATKGMGLERYNKHKELMRTFKTLVAAKHEHTKPLDSVSDMFQLTPEQLEGDLVDDIMLTNEQLEFEISRMQKRQKRKVINIDNPDNVYKPWGVASGVPIPYMFDTTISIGNRSNIRSALNIWMAETCVLFEEHTVAPAEHYILVTDEDSGCWSYIGYYTYYEPQPLNLPANCLSSSSLGTALHEFGHALGFFHEQSRYDRNDHVTVNAENIQPGKEHNFNMYGMDELSTLDVEYDMSSDMHYIAKAFAIDPATQETLTPNNPLYTYNLGQYIGLSYFDIKIFNKAFCGDVCTHNENCQRGGYADPKSCLNCKCPDGWGGNHCQQTAASSPVCNSPTNGIIHVTSTTATCIEVRDYPSSSSCNFHLQGQQGTKTQVWFEEQFGLLCSESYKICYHWVEVIFDAALNKRGARFCCYNTPTLPDTCDVVSEGTDVVVTMRSDYNYTPLPGFKLCYKQVAAADPCFNHVS